MNRVRTLLKSDRKWTPSDIPGCEAWYHNGAIILDRRKRWHWLNAARKITIWRRFRAWIGWLERDTMTGRYCPDAAMKVAKYDGPTVSFVAKPPYLDSSRPAAG